jgi:cell wall-associated NlpC family hydrolase
MAVLAAAAFIVMPLALMLLAAGGESSPLAASTAAAPTALAQDDIPADYLAWYQAAAPTCPGLQWQVLAGIGTVESDNGQSGAPGVHAGANFAGAEGPMQFEPATFTEYAVDADPDQPLSPYDPQDAIWTAAAMLCANGARGGTTAGIRQAVYAYNHATWYVNEVLAWAAKYAQPVEESPVAAQAIAYTEQQIGKPYIFSAGPDGEMTINPSVCPAQMPESGSSVGATGVVDAGLTAWQRCVAARVIAFAASELGKPYSWGATGPDAFDCSGLVMMAYRAAGVGIPRTSQEQWAADPSVPPGQEQPGDLVFFAGADGTDQAPGHVGVVLGGGLMIDAPFTGADVRVDVIAGAVGFTRPAAAG